MQMIRHIVYGNQLLLLPGHDAGDVFLKFVIVLCLDKALPTLDGKHDVKINLRVGVGHVSKMPLLAELENLFFWVLQRCRADGATKFGEFAGFASFADVQPEFRENRVTFRHDSQSMLKRAKGLWTISQVEKINSAPRRAA